METKELLTRNKLNILNSKKNIGLILVAILLQFGLFKYFYPYVSYIHGDSFSYIDAAHFNLSINTYLIGYSKFLRLFSVFTKSDIALAAFQFLFIQASAIFTIFTYFKFHKATKAIQIILVIIIVLNPLFLHLGNMVSSDGLFLALSFLWFSTLIWIFHHPSISAIIWHITILFFAFIFRYNALLYPFITVTVIILSGLSIRFKLLSVAGSLLPIFLFVLSTGYQYKKLTGHWQYSPFSGWQIANNAMYSFRYVDSIDRKPVPNKYKDLHNMVCEYFDSTRNASLHPIEFLEASTFYMWSPGLTLMKYKDKVFSKDTTSTELKRWASMAPLYKNYGIYIIKQYPKEFLKHFIWPNAKKYYAPPVEFLENFNSGKDSVTMQAKKWFGYKDRVIGVNMKSKHVEILTPYPIISGIVNAVLIFELICYTFLGGWKRKLFINKLILLGSLIWLTNAAFTITASSAALRFQSFPLMLTVLLSIILVDWMIQLMLSYNTDTIKNITEGYKMQVDVQ